MRTAISPRLAIRTEENMDMRYHPGDEEYTSPHVFHRPLHLVAGARRAPSLSIVGSCTCAGHPAPLLGDREPVLRSRQRTTALLTIPSLAGEGKYAAHLVARIEAIIL